MGQRDIALNATGRAQAISASKQLAGLGLTHVFVSPLERCQATCSVISQTLDLNVETVEALAERNWGVFEGGLSSARHVAFDTPPNGETTRAFHHRITRGLGQLGPKGFPLIVAHSGVFRVMTGQDENSKVGHAEPIVILVNTHSEQLHRKALAKRLAFQ